VKLDSYPNTYRYGIVAASTGGQGVHLFSEIIEVAPNGIPSYYSWDGNISPYLRRPTGTTSLNVGEWYHLAATVDETNIKLYVNGQEVASVPSNGNYGQQNPHFNFSFAVWGWGSYKYAHEEFDGSIDEAAIYNRALSPAEIQQHYENGLNGIGYLAIEVEIDIKPGSYPNSLNTDGHGVIPVAILGSADFDVTEIDLSSLSFAGLAVRVKGQGQPQCSVEDVSGDFSGGPEGAPDGYPDLVCHFVDNPGNWAPGDGEATITGTLTDGTPFAGSDEITVVPPQ
jgi:hypothetical protein